MSDKRPPEGNGAKPTIDPRARWASFVEEQEGLEKMRAFYGVQTDRDLALAQAAHIERLQALLPPIRNTEIGKARA